MKRIMLIVSYDGTAYCGWQRQPNAETVEETVEECLKILLNEDIRLIGASRTDSGVHALGNVAVFDTSTRIPAEKISYALNQRLPDDISVQESKEVACDFHPRHCDCCKTYEYQILNAEFPIPTERLYSYFVYKSLDLDKMKNAASYLIGEHDFKSFCSTATKVETTVRTVNYIDIQKEGNKIRIFVNGNGFLYNMVRIIVGTLVQVGLGRIVPERAEDILEAKERSVAGPTAPAHGLRLNEILYRNDEKSIDTVNLMSYNN